MKNTFGNNITITLFGESHGPSIGVVIDGVAPGIRIDEDEIRLKLSQRRPEGAISTGRQEKDNFSIESGVLNGYTTGTPIAIIIPNENTRSSDYIYGPARPGHADYSAFAKYHGFEDYRGGGHFSGRITAALCAAGGIFTSALKEKGIAIGTHIKSCAGISDREFGDIQSDTELLSKSKFPVLDPKAAENMQSEILKAKLDGDSVGGILQTCISGIPAGLGEPWFDSVESMLSHAMFSIPAVKGVSFGAGFRIAEMRGSEANDRYITDGIRISAKSNNNGGICGGITNGMPIIMECAVKPTPSIAKKQDTVDFIKNENTVLEIKGRHDPCIVHRARAVVDSLCAFVICDMLTGRFGEDFLASGKA